MTAETWLAWQAYAAREPWDEERADWRAGMLASVIAEIHRDRKRRPTPYTPKDFILDFAPKPPPRQQTPEEHVAILRLWVAAWGGEDRTTLLPSDNA